MIFFPPDAFSFRLNNQCELIELIHIGVQGQETVEHFAKQVNISSPANPLPSRVTSTSSPGAENPFQNAEYDDAVQPEWHQADGD